MSVILLCLLLRDALGVRTMAAANASHRKIRIRRVDFLVSGPGLARGIWAECL